jgi:hypothetical protein
VGVGGLFGVGVEPDVGIDPHYSGKGGGKRKWRWEIRGNEGKGDVNGVER